MKRFRDLQIGQAFDFLDDENPMYNSFHDRCQKISSRKYMSIETAYKYQVDSIDAKVFHVGI